MTEAVLIVFFLTIIFLAFYVRSLTLDKAKLKNQLLESKKLINDFLNKKKVKQIYDVSEIEKVIKILRSNKKQILSECNQLYPTVPIVYYKDFIDISCCEDEQIKEDVYYFELDRRNNVIIYEYKDFKIEVPIEEYELEYATIEKLFTSEELCDIRSSLRMGLYGRTDDKIIDKVHEMFIYLRKNNLSEKMEVFEPKNNYR